MSVPMLPIERFYRHQALLEDVQRLDERIAAIAETLYRTEDGPELDHLNMVSRSLGFVLRSLREAQNAARVECAPELLEAQMKASLELIGVSPERMRREKSV